MAVRYYTRSIKIDDETKSIYCDLDDANDSTIKTVTVLLNLGYSLYPFKKGRVVSSKKGDKHDKDYWYEQCKDDEEREMFEYICKNVDEDKDDKMKHGFFAAKSWLQKKHCLEACKTDEQREMFEKICSGEEKFKNKKGLSAAYAWLKEQNDIELEEGIKPVSKSRAKKTTEAASDEAK